jgi:hypothetical protein
MYLEFVHNFSLFLPSKYTGNPILLNIFELFIIE